MIDYGKHGGARESARGLGDPMTVAKQSRPTTQSLSKWTEELSGEPDKIEQCRRILASLTDEDLETWGYRRNDIAAELDAIDPADMRKPRAPLSRYSLERLVVTRLRRNIHHNALGRLVGRIRFACDLLLR